MKFKMTLETGREIDLEFKQTDEDYSCGETESYTTMSSDGSRNGKKINHYYRDDCYISSFKEINTGVEMTICTATRINITDKDYLVQSELIYTDGYRYSDQDTIYKENMIIPTSWNLSEDEEDEFLEKLDEVLYGMKDHNENILIEKIKNDEIESVYEYIGKRKVKQEQKTKRENKLSI